MRHAQERAPWLPPLAAPPHFLTWHPCALLCCLGAAPLQASPTSCPSAELASSSTTSRWQRAPSRSSLRKPSTCNGSARLRPRQKPLAVSVQHDHWRERGEDSTVRGATPEPQTGSSRVRVSVRVYLCVCVCVVLVHAMGQSFGLLARRGDVLAGQGPETLFTF